MLCYMHELAVIFCVSVRMLQIGGWCMSFYCCAD